MKSTTVCFTGHRTIPSGEKEVISKRLEDVLNLLVNKGYINFVAGGALGFDTLAAEKVLKLRKIYPDVRLILALPCLSQTNGWRFLDKMKYLTCVEDVTCANHSSERCSQPKKMLLL